MFRIRSGKNAHCKAIQFPLTISQTSRYGNRVIRKALSRKMFMGPMHLKLAERLLTPQKPKKGQRYYENGT